jgi:hypothetical protein
MRLFTIITLLSAFLIIWSKPFEALKRSHHLALPDTLKNRAQNFKKTFKNPQEANVLWAFLTGEKTGISPKIKKNFDDLQLSFLFSPSGMHLAALLSLILIFPRKLKQKKILFLLQWPILITALFLPYLAIVRISILRILILCQRFLKKRINIEILFFFTFFISFLIGHFRESPLGFTLSFLFMGTFISLRDYSKLTIIIGLFSNQLLICFFSGQETSFISLVLNLPLIGLFSFLLPFFYLYLLIFQWLHWNWIELVMHLFILTVKWTATLVQGTFTSSSFFLMLAVWVVLLKKGKIYFIILLFLHGNTANAPSIT